jgi:hypothetical protein
MKRRTTLLQRQQATIGSVSSGTMRAEDLIPEFADTLRYLRGSLPRDLHRDYQAWQAGRLDYDECELVDAFFDALNEYALPGFYFGAHPGDGADYGFWLSESFFEDFDGPKVSDTSDVPRDYRGEVLHVNDHGSATLYVANRGRLREIWAV